MLSALELDDFKNLHFKDFKEDLLEKIVVIYKTRAVSHDLIINQNMKPGDTILIDLGLNFNRETKYEVSDKRMVLEMLFHLNSIQNEDGCNQIQKVKNELSSLLKDCRDV